MRIVVTDNQTDALQLYSNNKDLYQYACTKQEDPIKYLSITIIADLFIYDRLSKRFSKGLGCYFTIS
jgi:hypothetical protein